MKKFDKLDLKEIKNYSKKKTQDNYINLSLKLTNQKIVSNLATERKKYPQEIAKNFSLKNIHTINSENTSNPLKFTTKEIYDYPNSKCLEKDIFKQLYRQDAGAIIEFLKKTNENLKENQSNHFHTENNFFHKNNFLTENMNEEENFKFTKKITKIKTKNKIQIKK